MITVVAEVLHDCPGIFQYRILEPLIPEKVFGSVRVDSGEKAGARWCTDRVVAVGPFESHAGPSKSGDVRGARLGMPRHARDIVVEVIADNHHYIGLSPLPGNRTGTPGRWDKGCNSPYHQALQKITTRFHIAPHSSSDRGDIQYFITYSFDLNNPEH